MCWSIALTQRSMSGTTVLHSIPDRIRRSGALGTPPQSRVAPRGPAIIALFEFDEPDGCGGLPVYRCGPETLSQTVGTSFEPLGLQNDSHLTPTGATPPFLWGHFQRRSN